MSAELIVPTTSPTIGDLRRTNFSGMQGNPRMILAYLDQLAAQTGTRIDGWGFEEFQSLQASNKPAINAIFFALAEKNAQGLDALKVVPQSVEETIRLQTAKVVKERIAALSECHQADLDAAVRLARDELSYLKKAWTRQKEILALENRGTDYLLVEVKKIISDGFWEFAGFENSTLSLTNRIPIVLTHTNAEAGIEMRVNMGHYNASINVQTMNLELKRHKQNVLYRPEGTRAQNLYYHPYVRWSGDICWGETKPLVLQLLAQGQLARVLNLLASLISTYWVADTTPYVELRKFNEIESRWDAEQEWVPPYPSCGVCLYNAETCGCCQECHYTAQNILDRGGHRPNCPTQIARTMPQPQTETIEFAQEVEL